MKISIIIPAYNAEKTISKCLDSIINQTYKNLEIIVINDGSTDSTSKIISEYASKDKRIKFIDNKNHGVSYTRNIGISISTGEYINFVDADDYLDIDCFEKIVPHLKNNPDFLRYNLNIIGGKSFNNDLYELCNKSYDFTKDNLEYIYRHFFTDYKKIPCLVMLLLVKKEIANKIKFNEKLTMMEDVDFYLQLFFEAKKGLFLDDKLYNYYVNPNSVTHNNVLLKKNIFGILDTNECIINRIKKTKHRTISSEINANHLRIIYSFLKNIYNYNKKEYRNTVDSLKKHKQFIKMLNNSDSIKKNIKIYYYLIKKNLTILEYLYMQLFDIYENIKRLKNRK